MKNADEHVPTGIPVQHRPLQVETGSPTAETVVLRIEGDLDHASAPHLHEQLEYRLNGTISALVIDLTAVTFVSSAGLRALDLGYLLALERGVELAVRAPAAETVRRVMRIFPMHFTRVMEAG